MFLRATFDPFLDMDFEDCFEFYRSNNIHFEKKNFDIMTLNNLLYNKKKWLFCLNMTLLTVAFPSEFKGQD